MRVPIQILRAARTWAEQHQHQSPDDRMLEIVYAAGMLAAGQSELRVYEGFSIHAVESGVAELWCECGDVQKNVAADDLAEINRRAFVHLVNQHPEKLGIKE